MLAEDRLSPLVETQSSVCTRAQLIEAGMTAGQINGQVAAGRWRKLNESVVVMHNGPLTREQQEWAAVLSAPGLVALCGLTAAARRGLRGHPTRVVHVLVPKGHQLLPLPGIEVKVHESRRFSDQDVSAGRQPPLVRAGRAVVDAASWSRSAHEAARILAAAIQQRLVTYQQLRAELDRAGRIQHCRMIRLLIADFEGGAQALSEVEFRRFCRRHGLPIPKMNVRYDRAGKRRYLDALFTLPDGSTLAVEIDGGIHVWLGQRSEDDLRRNDLVISGAKVGLQYTSALIYADDARVARQIRQALGLVCP